MQEKQTPLSRCYAPGQMRTKNGVKASFLLVEIKKLAYSFQQRISMLMIWYRNSLLNKNGSSLEADDYKNSAVKAGISNTTPEVLN